MKPKEILQNNQDLVVSKYLSGESTDKIGRDLSVNGGSVYVFLRDICGIEMKKQKTLADYSEKLKELYLCGKSRYEIGKILQLSNGTCSRYCAKLGLDFSNNSRHRDIPLSNNTEEIIKDYNSGLGCTLLSKKYNCAEVSITNLLKNNNIEIRGKKHFYNENYFEKINTKMKAYFLGLLYADGYNSGNSVILSLVDKEPIIKLAEEVGYSEEIVLVQPRKLTHQIQYKLCLNSGKMCEDLTKLGCMKAKTFLTYLPNDLQVPDEFKKHFLLGLLDGDGSIYIKNKVYFVKYTGNYELILGLSNYIFNKIGIKGSLVQEKQSQNKIFKITIGGRHQVKKFLDYLYKDVDFCLERKKAKYEEFLQKVYFNTEAPQNGLDNIISLNS